MRFNKFYILPTFFILVSSGSCGDDSAVAGLKNELKFQKDFSSYAVNSLYDALGKDSQNLPSQDYKILKEENKNLKEENKSLKQQRSSLEKEKIELSKKIEETKNSEDHLRDEITSKEKNIFDLINDKNNARDQLMCIIQAINDTGIPEYCINEILNKDEAIDQIAKIGVRFKQEIDDKNKATEMLKKSSSQLQKDLLECERNLEDIVEETIKEKNSLNFKSGPVDKKNIASIIKGIYTNQKILIKTNNEQQSLIDDIRLKTKKHQNNIQCEACKNVDIDRYLLNGIDLLYGEHNKLDTEVKKAIGKIDSNCQNNNLKKSSISEKVNDLINYYKNLLNVSKNTKGFQDQNIKSLTDDNNKLRNNNSKLETLVNVTVNQLNQFRKTDSLDIKTAVDLQFVGGDNPIINNFDNLFGNGGLLQTDIKNLRDSLIGLNNSNLKKPKTYNCQLFRDVEDKYIKLLEDRNDTADNNKNLSDVNKKIQDELNDEKRKIQNLLEKINNSSLSILYPVNNVKEGYDKVSKILDSVVNDSSNIDKVNVLLSDKNLPQNNVESFLSKVFTVIKYYKDKAQNLENIQNLNNSNKDNQVLSLRNKVADIEGKLQKIQTAINNADTIINNLGLKKANDFGTTVQLVQDVCDKYNKDLLLLENCINNKKIDGNDFDVKICNKVKDYIKDLNTQIQNNNGSSANKLNLKDQEIGSLNKQIINLKDLLNLLVGKINTSVLAQDKMGYNKQVVLDFTNNPFEIKNLDILSNVEADIKAILQKLNVVPILNANVVSNGTFCQLIEKLVVMYNDLKNKDQKLQNDKKDTDNAKFKIEQELKDTKKKLENLTNSIKDSGLISQNLIRGNTPFKITESESIENIFSNKNVDNVKKEKDSLQEIISGSANPKKITSDVIPIFKQASDKIFELQDQIKVIKQQNILLNDENKNKQKQLLDLTKDKDKVEKSYTNLEKSMNDLVAGVNNLLGKNGLGYQNLLDYDNNIQVVKNLDILKDKGTVVTELSDINKEIVKLNFKKKQLPTKSCKGSFAQQNIDLIQAYKDIQKDLIGVDSNNNPRPGAYKEMSKSMLYDLLIDTIYVAMRVAHLAENKALIDVSRRGAGGYSTDKLLFTWYEQGAYKASDVCSKLGDLEKILKNDTYNDNARLKYRK